MASLADFEIQAGAGPAARIPHGGDGVAGRHTLAHFLEQALVWPPALGEGKLTGIQENNIHYWLGQANRLLGREEAARAWFERASHGLAQPSSAKYYNDQPPEMIFYQGLAHRALGRESEAVRRFETLIGYGQAHLTTKWRSTSSRCRCPTPMRPVPSAQPSAVPRRCPG